MKDVSGAIAQEAGKAALAGAGGGTLFGAGAAALHSSMEADHFRCLQDGNWVEQAPPALGQAPSGLCSKVVDYPLIGFVDGALEASARVGVMLAVVVFILALAAFVFADLSEG